MLKHAIPDGPTFLAVIVTNVSDDGPKQVWGNIYSNVLNYSNFLFSKKDLFLSSVIKKGKGRGVEGRAKEQQMFHQESCVLKHNQQPRAGRPNVAYGLFLYSPGAENDSMFLKRKKKKKKEEEEEEEEDKQQHMQQKPYMTHKAFGYLLSGPLQKTFVDPCPFQMVTIDRTANIPLGCF